VVKFFQNSSNLTAFTDKKINADALTWRQISHCVTWAKMVALNGAGLYPAGLDKTQ
jgi:hypothetical protein